MIASIKLELWYLNTPEMIRLCEEQGTLIAKGAMLTLFECLRISHNAVGHRSMLKKVARDNNCEADWLWQIITDYGLFEFNADETFSSPYLSKSLGINQGKPRVHERTRYNNDNNHNDDKENKKKTQHVCVCQEGTQNDALGSPLPPRPAYLGYDRLVNGRRYGYRGEPIPDDAPEQVNQDTRWSWIESKWIARAKWNPKAERIEYEQKTNRKWQTIVSGQ